MKRSSLPKMLPKIFVQEHRLLEVAAQRCELVRADCTREVHLGHFRERRFGGFSLGAPQSLPLACGGLPVYPNWSRGAGCRAVAQPAEEVVAPAPD
jgi:hypothetical protein